MCRHISYMTNIYETTMIVKPDLANDQLKHLTSSLEGFFNDNNVVIGYKEDWVLKILSSLLKNIIKAHLNSLDFLLIKLFQKN